MAEKQPISVQDTIDEIMAGKYKIPTQKEYDVLDEIGEARMRPPKTSIVLEKDKKKA